MVRFPSEHQRDGIREFLRLAGFRYWTASLLPALVGTTLPFWLHPPRFSFTWFGAVEFLVAAVLLHAGFSLLHACVRGRLTARWPASRLLVTGSLCLLAAVLVGLHLNSLFRGIIFIVFGVTTLFSGALYVFGLYMYVGGEVVIAEGLGLLPILGAYLVQTGDLTRTVYLAALPVVVATAIWVWTDELITVPEDEEKGRRTMVSYFGPPFSARYAMLGLTLLFYATLFGAVFSGSIAPLALVLLLSAGLMWQIVTVSWNEYADPAHLLEARTKAVLLHLATCITIAVSALTGLF